MDSVYGPNFQFPHLKVNCLHYIFKYPTAACAKLFCAALVPVCVCERETGFQPDLAKARSIPSFPEKLPLLVDVDDSLS